MKRYIEIVYDNSGSMNNLVGKKLKYEIAQELFEQEILPTIGLPDDKVVLRLLRMECTSSFSRAEILSNQRDEMLRRIKAITHDQSTPLFHTVYDAIQACKNTPADEHLIFVLTDGDDTCGVKIEQLIDADTLKKYVRFYKVLLVQLAVTSHISRNNLTAFTNALGGRAISLDGTDSLPQMRKKLSKALTISGFSSQFPLEHCFDSLPTKNSTWEEVESSGMSYHQALLLFQKGFLTWLPVWSTPVKSLQLAELKFLNSLVFKSAMPEDLVRTMLSQLKKPYYYSFDCIFWDFEAARWKYFIPQNKIDQLPNDEARWDDVPEKGRMADSQFLEKPDYSESYTEDDLYRVEEQSTLRTTFKLVREGAAIFDRKMKTIILEPGDRVVFKGR